MSGMPSPAGHLVHGVGVAMEAPTWPAITPAEAEAVLLRFPAAGRLIRLRWHSPRPFSAATLVQTSRGDFFLKRHHRRLRSPEGLAEEHGFIAHLRAAGLPVPDIMTTVGKAGAVADWEWTYELHGQAPGADLYRDRLSWTPFLSHAHAHAAGAMLARLHRAARGYEAPPRRPQPLVASSTILSAPDPLAAAETYVNARPALAAFLSDRPWLDQLASLFGALGGGLPERMAVQPSLWTHNDWHPSNLLWTQAGDVSAVFDFGLATRTCALHDLATAVERTAVEWLRPGEDDIADAGTVAALLAGYRTVLPLASVDIETVAMLLPLVHVEFAMSEVDYFAGTTGDRNDAAVAWDKYCLGHAEWFLSAPGQAFLERIAALA